jgi:hypothetical protein
MNTPGHTSNSHEEIQDAVRSAFSEWNSYLSAAGISFSEVSPGEEAEISLEWSSRELGGVGLTTGSVIADFPTEIHKHIQLSDDLVSCCGAFIWSASLDPTSTQNDAAFVKAATMHEIGHALGLPDLSVQENQMGDSDISVMKSTAGFSNLESLSQIDAQKLRDRYGITGEGEAWLLEFEGTLTVPNVDVFNLDGAEFRLTMTIDPETIGTFHDIGAYLLSGYRTSEYTLEVDGHGLSVNSSAAVLIWDSQMPGMSDRLSIHAEITDANEAIPFDFADDMIFSLPGVLLPGSHFEGTGLQPVSNTDVGGVWPATVWRVLPNGEVERYVIGVVVDSVLVTLRLENR